MRSGRGQAAVSADGNRLKIRHVHSLGAGWDLFRHCFALRRPAVFFPLRRPDEY